MYKHIFLSIAKLNCTPSDRQMYPYGYMYPSLGIPVSSHLKYTRQKWDFCEEFTSWHSVTKCSAVEFVKLWMLSHFSELRDPNYDGLATW